MWTVSVDCVSVWRCECELCPSMCLCGESECMWMNFDDAVFMRKVFNAHTYSGEEGPDLIHHHIQEWNKKIVRTETPCS